MQHDGIVCSFPGRSNSIDQSCRVTFVLLCNTQLEKVVNSIARDPGCSVLDGLWIRWDGDPSVFCSGGFSISGQSLVPRGHLKRG